MNANDTVVIFQGSGQHAESPDESLTTIAAASRKLGAEVIVLDGVGSAHQVARHADRHVMSGGIEDVELGASTMLVGPLLGVSTGSGLGHIVDDAMSQLRRRRKAGGKLHVLGFSRGAVAAFVFCQQLERLKPSAAEVETLLLADPVPGPFISIDPSIGTNVRRVCIFEALDEGRPGFERQTGIRFDSRVTEVRSYLSTGIHGDVGGSSRSPMAALNREMMLGVLGLPGVYNNTMMCIYALYAMVCSIFLPELTQRSVDLVARDFDGLNTRRAFQLEGSPIVSDYALDMAMSTDLGQYLTSAEASEMPEKVMAQFEMLAKVHNAFPASVLRMRDPAFRSRLSARLPVDTLAAVSLRPHGQQGMIPISRYASVNRLNMQRVVRMLAHFR